MNTFAQILNGKVHLVMQDELTLAQLYAQKFNSNDITFVDITAVVPQPEVGWAYNGAHFTAPPATPAAIQKNLTMAVQNHMDSTAKARGYDNLVSVITYADEPIIPKFQAEGVAFRAWRSLVWDYCYQVLLDAEAGRRTVPTGEELIAELPELGLS